MTLRQAVLEVQAALIERYDGVRVKLRCRFGVVDSVYVDALHSNLNKAFTIRVFEADDDKPLYDLRLGLTTKSKPQFRRDIESLCMAIEDYFALDDGIRRRLGQACRNPTYQERISVIRRWLNGQEVFLLQHPLEETGGAAKWREWMEQTTPMGIIGGYHAYYK